MYNMPFHLFPSVRTHMAWLCTTSASTYSPPREVSVSRDSSRCSGHFKRRSRSRSRERGALVRVGYMSPEERSKR